MNLTISRRTLLATATATALLAALVAPLSATQAGSLARIDVYDRTAGRALPVYPHRGSDYIAGEPGHEYAVRIRNCSGRRMLAVVSVDGVNVVTGATASPEQSGYVIEPGDYVNVDGWRKDMQQAAAFYFTDPSDSYASRTGRPDDLGVIGVALFVEAVPPASDAVALENSGRARSSGDFSEKARAERAPSAPALAAEPSLGTGHGQRVDSPAQYVAFERASSRPDDVVRLRYESRDRLASLGILPRPPRWPATREPNAFPAAMSFVPDP
jgi:hypothetical protein